ncbi:hypothetical protein [Caldimonas taiwanensis]|uniref:hypothetical protein n=1 Tax=Caldimonas taiwanensis TaxID=307483 RepID=UPI0012F780D8|nr:hypothetical protein [Caldimonas taiwanensis]
MSRTVNTFSEGFIGAFKLAAAIVLAVLAAISAFVSGEGAASHRQDSRNGHVH